MAGRPERQAPPEIFYNEAEARKYTSNSRMIEIQSQLSERAIELLALPDDRPCFILDVGCGSGLSGECLTDQGHYWIGLDISSHMLDVAAEREVEGDLIHGDMGYGIPFRPGSFDGIIRSVSGRVLDLRSRQVKAHLVHGDMGYGIPFRPGTLYEIISISALQWLCNADKKYHHPPKRLLKFFSTLYSSMGRGARAVFQLYPENSAQLELITQQSMKAGFTGGLVVDYPNSTKAKKMFLCLFAGGPQQQLPKGLGTEESTQSKSQISFSDKRERLKQMRGKAPKKSRDWILEKKERRRRQGRETRPDTKYTGRKRKTYF